MKRIFFLMLVLASCTISFAQQLPVAKANYELAARFSPKKLEKMLLSTAVDPHWMKGGVKFWYT